ncbi:helix-turn-helix domain-containing protein [Natrialba sp. PRR66]|uniref:helix-turn-helix domain-containing protein n=1 Tax=Natrialba sp. PRR66 TaxID=3098146 RepID=UPI002B1E210F|nr:helix-turn-helix domain-containing protein [Natrialba sp. PRR66]
MKINQSATDSWLAKLSVKFSDAEFRVQTTNCIGENLYGVVEVMTSETDAIVGRFEQASAVNSYEILHADQQRLLIQYVIPVPESYHVTRASDNLLHFPMILRNGWIATETMATHQQLSRFLDKLAAADIPYQILSLEQSYDSTQLLTERQQEFISEAIKYGYYDSPRDCTLTELAEIFDINSSAASGILHRAESRIVKQFMMDTGVEVTRRKSEQIST